MIAAAHSRRKWKSFFSSQNICFIVSLSLDRQIGRFIDLPYQVNNTFVTMEVCLCLNWDKLDLGVGMKYQKYIYQIEENT